MYTALLPPLDSLSYGRVIRKGMENLKPDSCYDSLFASADCRNKADWILGINASYAMCMAMGLGNNSLGRVQTPILAAIADGTARRRTISHRIHGRSTSACTRTDRSSR